MRGQRGRGGLEEAGSGQPWAGWGMGRGLQRPPLDGPQGSVQSRLGLEVGEEGGLTSVRMVRLPWLGQVLTYRSKRTLGSATSRLGSASTPASSPWRPPNTTRACLVPTGGGVTDCPSRPTECSPQGSQRPHTRRGPVRTALTPPVLSPAPFLLPWLDPPEVGKLGGGHV